MNKVWYSKDRVRYKYFARLYDEAVRDFILSQELNVNAYHPSIPM